jgi:hypothetical protein
MVLDRVLAAQSECGGVCIDSDRLDGAQLLRHRQGWPAINELKRTQLLLDKHELGGTNRTRETAEDMPPPALVRASASARIAMLEPLHANTTSSALLACTANVRASAAKARLQLFTWPISNADSGI